MKMIDHNHFICHLILGTFTEYPFFCDRDRIQTCNRLIRSQLLYSVELRGQWFLMFQ